MTTPKFFIIKALTNLHVGSGDSNYGIIDNLVQRDPVTELPAIYGSSLKGALREFFEDKWGVGSEKVNHIFGTEDNEKAQSGAYKFLQANLLAFPVRSNKKAFFLATSKACINDYKNAVINLTGNDLSINIPEVDRPIIFGNGTGLIIEDFTAFQQIGPITNLSNLISIDNESIVIFNDEDFKKICGLNNLPVIARNQLENGTSNNLWYEEIVPRESRFWTCVLHDQEHYEDFLNELIGDKCIIHIGANASVGYGYTKFIKV